MPFQDKKALEKLAVSLMFCTFVYENQEVIREKNKDYQRQRKREYDCYIFSKLYFPYLTYYLWCMMDLNYDDIINLPHHVSKRHPQMPMYKRAAQFAPFAALTGHAAAIREAARTTQEFREPAADRLEILNRRMAELRSRLAEQPQIVVTYFQPDSRKAGGRYVKVTGRLLKILEYERLLEVGTSEDKLRIPFRYVVDLEE